MTEKSRRRRVRTPVVVIRKHDPVATRSRPSRPRPSRPRTTRPPRSKRSKKPLLQWRSKVLPPVPAPSANRSTDSASSQDYKSVTAPTSSPLEDVNPLLPIEIGDEKVAIKEADAPLRERVSAKESVAQLNDSVGHTNGTEDYSDSDEEDDESSSGAPANGTTDEYHGIDASVDVSNPSVVTGTARDLNSGNVTRSTEASPRSLATSSRRWRLKAKGTETFYYE